LFSAGTVPPWEKKAQKLKGHKRVRENKVFGRLNQNKTHLEGDKKTTHTERIVSGGGGGGDSRRVKRKIASKGAV